MERTVLLHGFSGHADCWDEVIGGLADPSSAHAITLYGHDFGRPVTTLTTFEREVDRIAECVQRELEAPVRICGYSLGGRVALGLLLRHPGLFDAGILVSAYPGVETEDERASRAARDEEWAERAEREGSAAFADAWAAQPLFDTQQSLSVAIRARRDARRRRHSGKALALAMRSLGVAAMPNLWSELSGVAQPVQLVVGELDTKFRGIAQRMAGELPHARVAVVEGCGHNVVLERPAALIEVLERETRAGETRF